MPAPMHEEPRHEDDVARRGGRRTGASVAPSSSTSWTLDRAWRGGAGPSGSRARPPNRRRSRRRSPSASLPSTIDGEGVAASVRDERRRDHDGVHDRRGEHERDGAPTAPVPSRRAVAPPAPTRTRTPGTSCPRARRRGTCSERGRPPILANVDAGTNTSMPALTNAPSTTNGIASTSREPKTIEEVPDPRDLRGVDEPDPDVDEHERGSDRPHVRIPPRPARRRQRGTCVCPRVHHQQLPLPARRGSTEPEAAPISSTARKRRRRRGRRR